MLILGGRSYLCFMILHASYGSKQGTCVSVRGAGRGSIYNRSHVHCMSAQRVKTVSNEMLVTEIKRNTMLCHVMWL